MTRINTLLALCLLFCTPSYGVDFDYSGFLSVGAGKIDSKEFRYNDYRDEWSFDSDTVLGLQLEFTFSDKLGFVAQGIARGWSDDDSNNYQPQIEWAYLTYEVTPRLTARAGRLGASWYMLSDYLEIGSAYVWIRPPAMVYVPGQSSFRYHEGVDLLYRIPLGKGYLNTQLYFASYDIETSLLQVESPYFWGINTSYLIDSLTVRFTYVDNSVELNVPSLEPFSDFISVDLPSYPALAGVLEKVDNSSARFSYRAFGFHWDFDRVALDGEATEVASDVELLPDARAWYLSIAIPLERFIPYFVIGEYRAVFDSTIGAEIDAAYGGSTTAGSLFLDAVLPVISSSISHHQSTYIVGLRYDISDTMDIKFELEQLSPKGGHQTTLISDGLGSGPVEKTMVYSVAFDMTF